jgi:hypothetical protein
MQIKTTLREVAQIMYIQVNKCENDKIFLNTIKFRLTSVRIATTIKNTTNKCW